MKKCPQCQRGYSDETLNFCLEDGAILSMEFDPEATLVDPEVTLVQEAIARPLDYSPRISGTQSKKAPPQVVFYLKCRSSQDNEGWFDSPPHRVSSPYPYSFILREPAHFSLIAKMSIWTFSEGLTNIIDVFIDDAKVATVAEKRNMNFLLQATVGELRAGSHEISLRAHYVDDKHINTPTPAGPMSAAHHLALRWLKVIARRA